ncbi:hypothetical protein ABVT39_019021 [Epinephelus coioides]
MFPFFLPSLPSIPLSPPPPFSFYSLFSTLHLPLYFSVCAPEEGLVRAIDAGSPPAGSPVGRTAHHSISLNSNTKGLLATNTGGGC